MTILITGGTGSFGTAFAEYLLHNTQQHIRIFSRDEHKQETMMRLYPPSANLSYILGDVRDVERLKIAMDGVDCVVHAAALKTVPGGERHANEFTKTNIDGTQNVIAAAITCGVKKSFFISSDKAVMPINTYGKTKAVAESIFIQANALGVSRGCRFSVARGGNVWASKGSVVPRWHAQVARGEAISVTDPKATRFHLPMNEWIQFVDRCLGEMSGGEIFIPKCRAWSLGDLASAFDALTKIVGVRGGDKQDETLIAPDEVPRTFDLGFGYAIEPSADLMQVMNYTSWGESGYKLMPSFVYTSKHADRLGVDELKGLIHET